MFNISSFIAQPHFDIRSDSYWIVNSHHGKEHMASYNGFLVTEDLHVSCVRYWTIPLHQQKRCVCARVCMHARVREREREPASYIMLTYIKEITHWLGSYSNYHNFTEYEIKATLQIDDLKGQWRLQRWHCLTYEGNYMRFPLLLLVKMNSNGD